MRTSTKSAGLCAVPTCRRDAVWFVDGTRAPGHCDDHSREALMLEDRQDFADEYAREDRRERELEL